MEDKCSFQEPMARLIKGNLFLDVFAFYNRVDVVEDPSENRLKKYHRMISIHFDRVALWDCRHRVQIILGKCYDYILAVTTWNLSTSVRTALEMVQKKETTE